MGYSSDCMPVVPGSYSASNFAGAANYPPAIDHIMAGLMMHSLSYMLMDKAVAQEVRNLAEKTIADTAHHLSKLHTTFTEGQPQG